jgi:hypothetical protein
MLVDGHAFERASTSVELTLGGHYQLFERLLIGAAVGIGALRAPGVPNARVLFRVAYSPIWPAAVAE